MTFPLIAIIGAFSLGVTWLTVGWAAAWLRTRQVLDVPNERSSHSSPIPRGGGLAIVALSLLGLLGLAWRSPSPAGWRILLVVAGGLIIAWVSFVDDMRGVATSVRLTVQVAVAVLSMLAFGPWSVLELGSRKILLHAGVAGLLTLVWIVGLTNAYNFMDGIDLMAAGQTVAAGLGWALLGALGGAPELMVVGTVVSFAAIGFAIHNRPPASIFMGDVGSAFLGYLFATLCLWGGQTSPLLATCGALLVWPFVFDTSFTFLRRLRRNEPVFSAHRSHLYQRLVITGLSHGKVSGIYAALDAIGIACAVALLLKFPGAATLTWIALFLSAAGLWLLVVLREKTLTAPD